MGAWDDLSLTAATLKGIAPVDLWDPDHEEYDSTRLTTEYLSAAKREVEAHITGVMPQMVAKVEGVETFLDDAVDITNAANLLQDLLAYAFLQLYYEQERFGDQGLFEAKRERAEAKFIHRVQALKELLMADEDFLDALEASSGEELDDYEGPVWTG